MISETDSTRRPLTFTPAGIAGTIVLGLVVIVCLRLGVWQLDRLEQRREMNRAVAARLQAPPIADVAELRDTAGLFYRTVSVRGTLDNERSIILPGRSRNGLPGVHLLSPLISANATSGVLVNRGWVPTPDAATIDIADFSISDTITVRGLVLPFPGAAQSIAPRAAPDDSAFRRVWYNIEEAALQRQFPYPLLPVLVQELPVDGESSRSSGPARYPARLEPPPLGEGSHLGYAIQWFAFAAIGVLGWIALVMRARNPPRGAPAAAILLLLCASPVSAQLRPVEPFDWVIFNEGVVAAASLGTGVLWDVQAPLAGTRGDLVEIGNYYVAFRSARMVVEVGGTALWSYQERERVREPVSEVVPSADGRRREPGHAMAATAWRLSPDRWPVDVMLRFGTSIPTTSDESGLERDRTDFFAGAGLRYTRGRFTFTTEQGVGINGTTSGEYPQSDAWMYSVGTHYTRGRLRAGALVVGRQDGHSWVMRGNEDMHELRLRMEFGTAHSIRIEYVHGLTDYAPARGLRIGARATLREW